MPCKLGIFDVNIRDHFAAGFPEIIGLHMPAHFGEAIKQARPRRVHHDILNNDIRPRRDQGRDNGEGRRGRITGDIYFRGPFKLNRAFQLYDIRAIAFGVTSTLAPKARKHIFSVVACRDGLR